MIYRSVSLLLCSLVLGSAPAIAQFDPPPQTQPLDTDAGGSRAIDGLPATGETSPEIRFVEPSGAREAAPNRPHRSLSISSTRGDSCSIGDADASPLPTIALTSASGGYTVRGLPSFAVFVPAMDADVASLEIYSEDLRETIVQLEIPLPRDDRILHVKLSQALTDATSLQPGESYWWAFTPLCNGAIPSDTVTPLWISSDPSPSAWIARVDSNSETTELPLSLTPLDAAIWYAERSVWFDSLDLLIAGMNSTDSAEADRAQRLWHQLIETHLLRLQAEYNIETEADIRRIADTPIVEIPPDEIEIIFPFSPVAP